VTATYQIEKLTYYDDETIQITLQLWQQALQYHNIQIQDEFKCRKSW